MPAAVHSTLDVVSWFVDRALDEHEYLQPQKLHRLLYLAQAYFAVANYGRKLMPAVFVAEEVGPVEPTVFHIYEAGRPMIDPHPLPEPVAEFLDSIWRRFGSHSADHLSRVIRGHPPYVQARRKGARAEIGLEAMREFYGNPTSGDNGGTAPTVADVLRPRVMRSQSGQPVSVNKWLPPTVKPVVKGKPGKSS